jgi:hypothetical protein
MSHSQKTISGNQFLTTFVLKRNTSEELKVSMIELAHVYHGVNLTIFGFHYQKKGPLWEDEGGIHC